MTFPNDISATLTAATDIQAGESYGYMTSEGRMSSMITIGTVKDGIASAICSHWDQSWIVSFDAETGKGVRDFEGSRLVHISGAS